MKLRTIAVVAAIILTGLAAVGQRRGGGSGIGRVVNPRGMPAMPSTLVYAGSAGPIVPRTAPLGGPAYIAPPLVPHPVNHGVAVLVPYPVYYGGGYYGYDAPPAPYAGGYYFDPSGARQDAPAVIINQGYVPETINPSFQDYSNAQLPPAILRRSDLPPSEVPTDDSQAAPANQPSSIYLIALKDHTIYAAIGYWIENQTLHYITPENVHNRVSLDQVDRAFTKQLNDERHIELRLPDPQ